MKKFAIDKSGGRIRLMDTLIKIFGSAAKVKVIKLFVFNPDNVFDVYDISERTKENVSKIRREVNNLEKAGLLKQKVFLMVHSNI